MAMKKLTELVIRPSEVKVDDDQSFEVRHIDIEKFAHLLLKYRPQFEMLLGGKNGIDFAAISTIAPDLMREIIATAVGDTGEATMEAIKNLPAGTQMTAVAEIWRLTIPDEKKLKSFLSVVAASLRDVSSRLVETALKDKATQTELSTS